MPEYRRHEAGGQWHWCRNCSIDPKADYLVRYVRPERDRDLCPGCEAKEAEGVCNRVNL
jgi:hypothetical protein